MEEAQEQRTVRFYPITEAENAPDLEPIWGNWLFKGSVVLQVGEPGIAKTTFNYQLAKAFVDSKPFLGVEPVCQNIKVLYLDWESSPSLIKSRVHISGGYPENAKNFLVYSDTEFTLANIEKAIDEAHSIFPFNIIFIDPIRMAFNMRDENDNPEGSRQMRYLRTLAKRWNCTILAVHHCSKADLPGTKKASGAYARTGLADIVWNFEYLDDEDEHHNMFKFSIPKNRLIDDGFKVCVEKREGEFIVVSFPDWYARRDGLEPSTVKYTIQQKVDRIMSPYVCKSPHQVHEEIGGKNTCTRQAIHQALFNLIGLNRVRKDGYAGYKAIGERL